ncbi:MAG TPA: hypothetical protein VK610_06610 [Rhodothermales bacterium]|nr:hypothetical protein [Rhodothermales bacterium]
MPSTLPRPTLAARLANAVRADLMRRAHAHAADVFEGCAGRVSYAACLRAGMTAAHAGEGRRVSPATLASQARAFVAVCASVGSRFDFEKKAADALTFSLSVDVRGLLIPSKLVGTSAGQRGLGALRATSTPALHPLRTRRETDGLAVYFGADFLGRLQPKHDRWAQKLGAFRVAFLAVTGGTEDRPTMGVNVAFEVWPVLPPSPEDVALDARADDEEDARHLYGEAPAFGPGTLGAALVSTDARTASDAWARLGGWEQ